MRQKIYNIIEVNESDKRSTIYALFMILVIIASLIPLAFKDNRPLFQWMDRVAVVIFIIDYLLRWMTADIKYQHRQQQFAAAFSPRRNVGSFLRYPLSGMAIIDLLSILPSVTVIHSGFNLIRILRMMRAVRVIRVFKAVRYSKSIALFGKIIKKQSTPLIAVGSLTIIYIVISALIVFNIEPQTFQDFFDALYWATISLTTIGYGDISPVTDLGRGITMLSAIIGIAIMAIPASIITAGYMSEIMGEKIEEASEKVAEKVEQMGEKIEEDVEEIGQKNLPRDEDDMW